MRRSTMAIGKAAGAVLGVLLLGQPLFAAQPGAPSAGPTASAASSASPTASAASSASPAAGASASEQEPMIAAIDIEGNVGFDARLDSPPALDLEQPVGLTFGGGVDVFFSRAVAVGLRIEHLDLGQESSPAGAIGTMRLSRDLNGAWLGLRAYPFENDDIGAFLGIGAAAIWQSLDASGSVWLRPEPGISQSFQCEGSDSISVGLRAIAGVDVAISPAFRFWGTVGLDTYRLSDAVLDGCAPGAGNASVFGLTTGLSYRFAPGI